MTKNKSKKIKGENAPVAVGPLPKNTGQLGRVQKKRSGSVSALVNSVNRLVAGGTKLHGRGGYVRDTLVTGAGMLGDQVEGTTLGRNINNVAGMLLGRGAYRVDRNDIMKDSTQVPNFKSSKEYVEVEAKEFVCNVTSVGSAAFSILQTLDINAALQTSFPMLSQTAQNFEEYEFMGLVGVYEPTSGYLSTTQGLGDVTIATQYDMADTGFSSEVEMKDYVFSTSCKPSESMIHPIECDPKKNPLARFYCRTGLLANGPSGSSQDIRYNATDLGRTTIAIVGVPAAANVVLGKFYWVGKVRLYKPKLYNSIASGFIFQQWASVLLTATTPVNVSSGTASAASNLGGTLDSAGQYIFPTRFKNLATKFYVVCNFLGTSGSWTYNPALQTNGATSFTSSGALSSNAATTTDTMVGWWAGQTIPDGVSVPGFNVLKAFGTTSTTVVGNFVVFLL